MSDEHGNKPPGIETISLPATLKAEGLPDFAEVMRLPPEVLRERYWTQREWIRSYAHSLDGLLGAGADYSGLLPQDIRRAFEERGELKAGEGRMPIELEAAAASMANLIDNQTELDGDAKRVLYGNLNKLYLR